MMMFKRCGAGAGAVKSILFGALIVLALGASSAYAAVSEVRALAPTSGLTSGGTTVKIRGTNFVSGATVVFGATAATGVTVNSSSEITATAPAGAAGLVDVRVTTPDGQSAVFIGDKFRYGSNVPTSLQADEAGTTRVALRWTAPALPGVLGYTVLRNGAAIGTTGAYKTNFIDTGRTAGTTYTYTVTAQLLTGSTAASASLPVTTASLATPISSCSGTPLTSGDYVLTADLGPTGATCLTIASANNVSIDCAGHTLRTTTPDQAIRIDNASKFLIYNCHFPSSSPGANELGIYVTNSNSGTIANSSFGTAGTFTATYEGTTTGNSSQIAWVDNASFDKAINLDESTDSYVGGNTITYSTGNNTGSNISVGGGGRNIVDGNTLEGGQPFDTGDINGVDDGVVVSSEVNDIIVNNRTMHHYDAGVETIGFIAGTTIANNTFESAWLGGVTAFNGYKTSWLGNTVRGNQVTNSGSIFFVETSADGNQLPAGHTTLFFAYNTFDQNELSSVNSCSNNYCSQGGHVATTPSGPQPLVATSNAITSNDFGQIRVHANAAPAGLVTTDLDNSCKTSVSPLPGALACASSTLKPEYRNYRLMTVPAGTHVLSTEGATDWSHWGLSGTQWDHKSGGTNLADVQKDPPGMVPLRVSTSVTPTTSWSGGTPTATSGGTATGITTDAPGIGRGFIIPVSNVSNDEPISLKLYVGVLASSSTGVQQSGKLELYWSSDPGNVVTDAGSFGTTSTTTAANRIYQITARPPQASDTLNVRWRQNTSLARVRIYAATMNKVSFTRTAAPPTAALPAGASLGANLDWAHWGGTLASPSSSITPVRKTGGTALANFQKEGSGSLSQANNGSNPVSTAFIWSGGNIAPAAGTLESVGLASTGGAVGRGFSLTAVPDATNRRVLRLFVGTNNTSATSAQTAKLELFWGSSSIPFITDVVPAIASSAANYRYTINLKNPLGSGTTLKAKWTTNASSSSHRTTLQSAQLLQ